MFLSLFFIIFAGMEKFVTIQGTKEWAENMSQPAPLPVALSEDDLEVSLYDYYTGETTVVNSGDTLYVQDYHSITVKSKDGKLFGFSINNTAGHSEYSVQHGNNST